MGMVAIIVIPIVFGLCCLIFKAVFGGKKRDGQHDEKKSDSDDKKDS